MRRLGIRFLPPPPRLLALLLFTVVLGACSDLVTVDPSLEPQVSPTTIPSKAAQPLLGTGQSKEIDETARALALALADGTNRMKLLEDLRDSPFPQHRVHLSAYLSGRAGRQIAAAMAPQMSTSQWDIQVQLSVLPDLEIVMPRMYDRAFWQGDESVIVVGLQDLDTGFYAPLRGFDLHGEEHVVEMWRGILDRPILMIYPVQHDFGANPEQQRLAAPKRSRNTIGQREDEFDPRIFHTRKVTPADRSSDAGIMNIPEPCDIHEPWSTTSASSPCPDDPPPGDPPPCEIQPWSTTSASSPCPDDPPSWMGRLRPFQLCELGPVYLVPGRSQPKWFR